MLRRLSLALRAGLWALGIALIVLIPFSWFFAVSIAGPHPMDGSSITIGPAERLSPGGGIAPVERGAVTVYVFKDIYLSRDNQIPWGLTWDRVPTRFSILLQVKYEDHVPLVRVRVPLWMLALLCLAWPVTSSILARRRWKGRGFAVEAGGGGPAPGIDPPPRRPDNIPPP
jgi:hypothetical protein